MRVHDRLDAETLAMLADASDGAGTTPRVSLYVPMVVAGPETRQNAIRFKNVLREARSRLAEAGVASADIDAMLASAEASLDDALFWQHQQRGLAVFLPSPGEGDGALAFRLPLEVTELCTVTDRFHLKPLFSLLGGDGTFHVLALSQKQVRLFEATRHAVRELALDDEVPRSLSDALGHELTEPQLRSHSPSAETGIFHGQGAGTDDVKPEIRKFLKILDGALAPALRRDGRDRPLVLAAVESLAAMYREVTEHRALVDEPVTGNPEQRPADELHAAAWPLVEPIFDRARHESVERFGNSKAGGTCSTDVSDVVIAAQDGRIDTLFVARGERRWGWVDVEARTVERHDEHVPGDEDLLDRAAVATFRTGGQVFAVPPDEVPDGAPLAAIYRY